MSRKMSTRTSSRKAIPSLVGALMAKSASFTDLDNISLRALVALDAFHRGKGSIGLLALLGRHLVVCENLCESGFETENLRAVREAHAALVRVDWDAQNSAEWKAAGVDYEALREALAIYDRQLQRAPRGVVQRAQISMVAKLTLAAAEERQQAA
jgi:hypothetical protein